MAIVSAHLMALSAEAETMLVISRFSGESIVIESPSGKGIAVARCKSNQVPLSTYTKKHMLMVREQLPEWLKYVA